MKFLIAAILIIGFLFEQLELLFIGLTQTGDESPYYKLIYLGRTCVSQK